MIAADFAVKRGAAHSFDDLHSAYSDILSVASTFAGLHQDLPCRSVEREWLSARQRIFQSFKGASPDISHYLCMIEQVCATICSVFCRRTALWRRMTRDSLGLFRGCGCSEDEVSVGL